MSDLNSRASQNDRAELAQGTLTDVAQAVDTLVVLTRAGLRRAIVLLIVCSLLIGAASATTFALLQRAGTQQAQLQALAERLEMMAAEQAKTRQATEEVKEQVQDAQNTRDQQPTLELRPTTKAGKPAAVVVITPAKKPQPAPVRSGVGSAAPVPIEIPVRLEDTKQQTP